MQEGTQRDWQVAEDTEETAETEMGEIGEEAAEIEIAETGVALAVTAGLAEAAAEIAT